MKIFHKQFNLFYKDKKLQYSYSFNVNESFQDLLEYVIELFPNFNFCPCFYFTNMNDEKINNQTLLYNSKDIYSDFKIVNPNPDNKCYCSADIKNLYNKSKKEIIDHFSKKIEDIQKKLLVQTKYYNKIIYKDFYDIIINIKSIKDIINGWEIRMSKEGADKYSNYKKEKDKFIKIGVIGNKNRGKSYILSKLAKTELKNNYSIETTGLSFKYQEFSDNKDKKFVFIDSAGLDKPFIINEKEDDNEIKNDKLITELFLQNYIFYNSDIVILVIGYLTFSEQKLLNRIKNLIKKEKIKKPLYIIHNLKTFNTIEQVKEYIKEYVIQNSPFDLEKGPVIGNDKNNKNVYFYEKNSESDIYHLILAKEDTEAGDFYNKFTLNFLEMSYTKLENLQYFDVIQSIKESFINISKQFIEINDKQNSFNIDDFCGNTSDYKYIKLKNEKTFTFKNIYINELNNFNSDTNIFAPPYNVFKPKDEDKIIIVIEAPGSYTIRYKISYEGENTIISLQGKKRKDIELENITDNNIYNTRLIRDFYLDIPLKTEKYPLNIYPNIYDIKGLIFLEFRLKKKDEENTMIYEGKKNNNIIVNINNNNNNNFNGNMNKKGNMINFKELNDNSNNKIIELMNKIKEKDNEITELKTALPFDIKKGDKLMSVIISSYDQRVNCSFICKNTDIFNKLENSLYDKYPEYKEVENYFVVNGNRINKYKNLEENKIKDNEIITLITVDY